MYQKTLNNLQLRGLKNTLHRVGTINLKLTQNQFTQNQFQKFNAGPLYTQLWKLQNTQYKTYTIPGIFSNIPRNLLEHSPESSSTFPGNFFNIPRNLFERSPESSGTFPRIFFNISRNLLEHSLESSSTIPGMLK